MEHPYRRNDVRIVTVRDVKQYVTEGYVKVTTVRLTMSASTGPDVYEMCRLAWYLGRPIVSGSLSVLDTIDLF
jgi:hypothetical protein